MTAPPRHRRSTPSQRPWPTAEPRPAEIVLAGAHGGAGTSTLAVLLAPAWDMGVIRASAGGGLRPGGRPVVLAARNTVAAAGWAATAVTAVTAVGVPVAVLVVIGDGLPEPAESRYRFRVLEGRVGAVVRMPFIPAFRVAGSPAQVRLPRRARRALAEIRALAGEQAPCPPPTPRPQGRP
jgi:hypothetical protein